MTSLLAIIAVVIIFTSLFQKRILTYKQLKTFLLFISTTSIAILIFIISFIVPKFSNIFKEMNIEVPTLTKWILALSTLKVSIIIFGVVLIGLILAILQNENVEKALQVKLSRNLAVITVTFIVLLGLIVGIIVISLFLPLVVF